MHQDLDPPDARVAPLLQALGRAVLGAGALEKILLVDIAQRRAKAEGLVEQLSIDLARLERKPGGTLLETLKVLGLSPELSDRVTDVIRRRNVLVHHFMEDPQLARAAQGEDVNQAVDRIDQVAADCQALVNDIAPAAFAGIQTALGIDFDTVVKTIISIDPADISDAATRAEVEKAQQLMPAEWRPNAGSPSSDVSGPG